MEGNVVRLPRRPLAKPAVWLDGTVQSGCDELVHLWEGLAQGEQPHAGMRCQCGERAWERIDQVPLVQVSTSEGAAVRVRSSAWVEVVEDARACCGDPADCGEGC